MFGKKKFWREGTAKPDVLPVSFPGKKSPPAFPGKRKYREIERGLNHPDKIPTLNLAVHPSHATVWPVQNIPSTAICTTRYREKGYEKVTSYKKGIWDGWTQLGRTSGDGFSFDFPLGLLPKFMQACEDAGVRVLESNSTRVRPEAELETMGSSHLGGGFKLRDYQVEAANAFVDLGSYESVGGLPSLGAIEPNRAEDQYSEIGDLTRYRVPGTGIIWAATGSGKTVSSASVVARLGVRTLFMVYGNDLVRQTWRNFNNMLGTWLLDDGHQVGIAVEGDFNPGFVTVAGSSTLATMLMGPERAVKKVMRKIRKFLRLTDLAIDRVVEETFESDDLLGFEEESDVNRGKLREMRTLMARWLDCVPSQMAKGRNVVLKLEALGLESLEFRNNALIEEDLESNIELLSADSWKSDLEAVFRAMNRFPGKFQRCVEKQKTLVDYLKTVDLLIVDEVHKAASSGAYAVAQTCSAFYRLGMSGTPLDRADGANLKVLAAFGEVVMRVHNRQMRTAGVIPDARIRILEVPAWSTGKKWEGKPIWNEIYSDGIVLNGWRNEQAVAATKRVYDAGGKVLVLFRVIEHGKILGELLDEVDVPATVLDGASKTQQRRDALDSFSAGDIRVIVASAIFGTGIDIPDGFDLLLLMGGGKGKGKGEDERGGIAVLQNLGRGLRGDGQVEVIDFMDNQHPILRNHSVSRFQIYQGQGCFEVTREEDQAA